MYNVLIVDDEREIRHGLRLKVDWEKLNLCIAGEASNGEEAVQVIADMKPDLIITDMKMPFKDGVSLLEYCSRQHPHIRLIVITGYNDFQYTKAAIQNRATDYLLKPVSKKELAASLAKVVKEMDEERVEKSRHQAMDWKMSLYAEEIKSQFILNAVKPFIKDIGVLEKRANFFQLADLAGERVRFVCAGLTAEGVGREEALASYRLPFELLCRELAQQDGNQVTVFQDPGQPNLMFFIMKDNKSVIDAFIRHLEASINRYIPFRAYISVGAPATGLREWRESFTSAFLAWQLRTPERPNGDGESYAVSPMMSQDTAKQLQWHLIKGEREPFERLLGQQFNLEAVQSPAADSRLILQIVLIIEAAARSLGIRLTKQEEMWATPVWLWEIHTQDKAVPFLMDLADKLFNRDRRSASSDQSVVESIKEMIRKNYMLDINLGMLAEQYNYNASYLSDLFKTKTGMTFVQFLTHIRMEKAVQLLKETELGLSEIAELTGFSNVSYFSVKFKKVFGVNPSTIRQPEQASTDGIQ